MLLLYASAISLPEESIEMLAMSGLSSLPFAVRTVFDDWFLVSSVLPLIAVRPDMRLVECGGVFSCDFLEGLARLAAGRRP